MRAPLLATLLVATLTVAACSDSTSSVADGRSADADADAGLDAIGDAPASGDASVVARYCAPSPAMPSYGSSSCAVNKPAQPDLLDDALGKIGLDRCALGYVESDKLAGAAIWDDGFRLPFYDAVHQHALRAPPFARAVLAALDDAVAAERPVTRALKVATHFAGDEGEVCSEATSTGGDAPLVDALVALIDGAGGSADRAALQRAAAGVPPSMRAALAPIIDAIAATAKARDLALRDADLGKTQTSPGVELPTLYQYLTSIMLRSKSGVTIAPRETWVQNLLRGEASGKGFAYKVLYSAAVKLASTVEGAQLERFAGVDAKLDVQTPLGRVIVGGPGDDTYEPKTHGTAIALLVETGGKDTYRIPAGATSGAENPVSVHVDLGGDDRYGYDEVPHANDGARLPSDADGRAPAGDPKTGNGPVSLSETSRQGAARLGVGLLFDLGKSKDSYRSLRLSQGFGALGVGVLYDDGGDDLYEGEAGVQGAGIFGVGLLLDMAGKDTYRTYHASQGFAFVLGVGVLYDAAGDDAYLADVGDPAQGGDPLYFSSQRAGTGNSSFVQGAGFGRRADFSDQVFMSGGLGVLRDADGDDRYEASVFAQGTGYWFGTGILADKRGKDQYDGLWYVQGASAHFALSLQIDDDGDDRYNQKLVPAATSIGVGHDFSVSFHIDGGGNDVYQAPGLSLGAGNENGFGFFFNLGGDDRYETRGKRTLGGASISAASAAAARANVLNVGVFVDSGGKDTYRIDGNDETRDDSDWIYQSTNTTTTKEHGVGLDGSGSVDLP
ncbi:MAG: hypothetical protein KC503_07970 [Myxococcales bacterium]|nr:hypothetical protein [Myxococcales bacterium]